MLKTWMNEYDMTWMNMCYLKSIMSNKTLPSAGNKGKDGVVLKKVDFPTIKYAVYQVKN